MTAPSRWRAASAYQGVVTVALLVLVVLLGVGTVLQRSLLPVSAMVLPLMAAAFLLTGPRLLLVVAVTCLAALAEAVFIEGGSRTAIAVVVVALVAVVVLRYSLVRERYGLSGSHSSKLMVDLRDRLRVAAPMPDLPPGWVAEAVVRSYENEAFRGDFVVAAAGADDVLEVALVDVSGHGMSAAPRALQLSGAFGGLIGAVEPERFLAVCNDYVLRQGWSEGFATAAHLVLHLPSGQYALRSAGHPPALHRCAATGSCLPVVARGPVLGVVSGLSYPPVEGQVEPGDGLLLYTDGMVEQPGQDVADGIAALADAAARGWDTHPHDLAAHLMARAARDETDDMAVVVIRRLPAPA